MYEFSAYSSLVNSNSFCALSFGNWFRSPGCTSRKHLARIFMWPLFLNQIKRQMCNTVKQVLKIAPRRDVCSPPLERYKFHQMKIICSFNKLHFHIFIPSFFIKFLAYWFLAKKNCKMHPFVCLLNVWIRNCIFYVHDFFVKFNFLSSLHTWNITCFGSEYIKALQWLSTRANIIWTSVRYTLPCSMRSPYTVLDCTSFMNRTYIRSSNIVPWRSFRIYRRGDNTSLPSPPNFPYIKLKWKLNE